MALLASLITSVASPDRALWMTSIRLSGSGSIPAPLESSHGSRERTFPIAEVLQGRLYLGFGRCRLLAQTPPRSAMVIRRNGISPKHVGGSFSRGTNNAISRGLHVRFRSRLCSLEPAQVGPAECALGAQVKRTDVGNMADDACEDGGQARCPRERGARRRFGGLPPSFELLPQCRAVKAGWGRGLAPTSPASRRRSRSVVRVL